MTLVLCEVKTITNFKRNIIPTRSFLIKEFYMRT